MSKKTEYEMNSSTIRAIKPHCFALNYKFLQIILMSA